MRCETTQDVMTALRQNRLSKKVKFAWLPTTDFFGKTIWLTNYFAVTYQPNVGKSEEDVLVGNFSFNSWIGVMKQHFSELSLPIIATLTTENKGVVYVDFKNKRIVNKKKT